MPQRLTIGLEVVVLGLSSFRLLQAAGVGAAAASLNWLLVAFGLGNQAIAFLVNNALQGSILAAAIFLEAVMVLLRLLARPGPPARQAAAVVAALMAFTLLEMKLHGAFALSTLLLLVPLLALVGAARLGDTAAAPAMASRRSTAPPPVGCWWRAWGCWRWCSASRPAGCSTNRPASSCPGPSWAGWGCRPTPCRDRS